ncbi:MAG: phosphohistidine phosphatase SixA [Acidiferrobacterales bacterium]
MIIYLARHGDYLNGNDDFTRGLSERGRADIAAVARSMKTKGVQVSATLHSGKLRAQQTAEILADELMPSSVISLAEGLAPNDDPVAFEMLHFPTLASETLIVGHLPFMGLMVSHLLTGDPDRSPEAFEAGTVVCLERVGDEKWSKRWVLHPSSLPKQAT